MRRGRLVAALVGGGLVLAWPATASASPPTAHSTDFAGYTVSTHAETAYTQFILPKFGCTSKPARFTLVLKMLAAPTREIFGVGIVGSCRNGVASYSGMAGAAGRLSRNGAEYKPGDKIGMSVKVTKTGSMAKVTDFTTGSGVGIGSSVGGDVVAVSAGIGGSASASVPPPAFGTVDLATVKIDAKPFGSYPSIAGYNWYQGAKEVVSTSAISPGLKSFSLTAH